MDNHFTSLYLRVREKENRIYTDEEVRSLPWIGAFHPHHKEWKIRGRSARRLADYLKNKRQPLRILEVGCGNGWLSAYLAKNPGLQVTGIDINDGELNQAKRVFGNIANLDFQLTDLSGVKPSFDIIVFAASIQYFSSLQDVIILAFTCLQKNGEIHLIDSPLYKESEMKGARERTNSYYNNLGFPEMASFYFHHSKEDLNGFNYNFPGRQFFFSRFLSAKPPAFNWVCIKATNSVNSTIRKQ